MTLKTSGKLQFYRGQKIDGKIIKDIQRTDEYLIYFTDGTMKHFPIIKQGKK